MLVEKMGFNVSVTGVPKTKIFEEHTQTTGFWGVLLNLLLVKVSRFKIVTTNPSYPLHLLLHFFYFQKITVENSQAVKIIQLLTKAPR